MMRIRNEVHESPQAGVSAWLILHGLASTSLLLKSFRSHYEVVLQDYCFQSAERLIARTHT